MCPQKIIPRAKEPLKCNFANKSALFSQAALFQSWAEHCCSRQGRGMVAEWVRALVGLVLDLAGFESRYGNFASCIILKFECSQYRIEIIDRKIDIKVEK